ncbi:hypothetical protein MP638_007265 [Amoeboaphelidium occidentale]|nr:hypothetical protein MP638_007265 [Amoeboaphelidium occidentale]
MIVHVNRGTWSLEGKTSKILCFRSNKMKNFIAIAVTLVSCAYAQSAAQFTCSSYQNQQECNANPSCVFNPLYKQCWNLNETSANYLCGLYTSWCSQLQQVGMCRIVQTQNGTSCILNDITKTKIAFTPPSQNAPVVANPVSPPPPPAAPVSPPPPPPVPVSPPPPPTQQPPSSNPGVIVNYPGNTVTPPPQRPPNPIILVPIQPSRPIPPPPPPPPPPAPPVPIFHPIPKATCEPTPEPVPCPSETPKPIFVPAVQLPAPAPPVIQPVSAPAPPSPQQTPCPSTKQ